MTLSTTRSVQRITRISELVSAINYARYSTANYADKRIGECINYARYSTANYADKRIGECN